MQAERDSEQSLLWETDKIIKVQGNKIKIANLLYLRESPSSTTTFHLPWASHDLDQLRIRISEHRLPWTQSPPSMPIGCPCPSLPLTSHTRSVTHFLLQKSVSQTPISHRSLWTGPSASLGTPYYLQQFSRQGHIPSPLNYLPRLPFHSG